MNSISSSIMPKVIELKRYVDMLSDMCEVCDIDISFNQYQEIIDLCDSAIIRLNEIRSCSTLKCKVNSYTKY